MGEKEFASALGRIPSGLFILTVRQDQVETGMLASWVQQCSFSPPRVSLAIKPERGINQFLQMGNEFVLSIVSTSSKHLINHFARGFELDQPAFEGIRVQREGESPAILSDGLAYLICQVKERFSAGDHDLVIGEVRSGALLNEGEPRIHLRKNGLNY